LYRLDAQKDPKKIAPVEGVIYRRDHGEPPRSLQACLLRLPGGYYLGEHDVYVRVDKIITDAEWPQVIIEDLDPEGNIVEASLFQWQDSEKDNAFAPYDPNKMLYKLVGWFTGEGGVKVEQDKVTVIDRIAGMRSRLANRKVYVPDTGTKTYYRSNGKLVDPETDLIALIDCTDPNAMCYPERTVLAFYQVFQDNSALEALMTPEALQALKDGKLKYGCVPDRASVDRALAQDKEGKLTNMVPVTWVLERNNEGKWLLKSSK
jgi:hypothetical protein